MSYAEEDASEAGCMRKSTLPEQHPSRWAWQRLRQLGGTARAGSPRVKGGVENSSDISMVCHTRRRGCGRGLRRRMLHDTCVAYAEEDKCHMRRRIYVI
jgi:hypothetical protein